ncbi:RNA binding function [Plasmodium gonderi]|uniref:RNA binding function n=1 Tax=Plasmodium gonderi TaxID=77519 RepID=A0A1Y1JKM3_PLAGO|nr:RNA binding function [Plasmodium gonderi]GAW81737.1 RNA binding function [Plasmodium gonderi]
MSNTNKTELTQENKGMNNSNTTKTLWVGDLDKIKDEVVDENYILYCMFYEFAEDIIKVKLCKERTSQKTSYAFIEFTSFDIAKYCFDNLNGKWIPGRMHKFKLNWAKYNVSENVNTNTSEKSLDVELDDKGTYSIYVGGLPKGTTKEEIETLFSRFYTSICFVKMIKNMQKNQNRIYCFIHFFNHDECIRALAEMDGYDFKGCKIKVSTSNGAKINKGTGDPNNYYYKNGNYQMHLNNLKVMNMGMNINMDMSNYNMGTYVGNYAQGGSYPQGNCSQANYDQANYNASINNNNDNSNNNNNDSTNENDNSNDNNSGKSNNDNINNSSNNKITSKHADKEEGKNSAGVVGDSIKNYHLYYNSVNNELNNPYKVNYYDHLNSNITAFPMYNSTANRGTTNMPYNSNNYGNEMNYYTGQMAQMVQMHNYGNDGNPINSFSRSNEQVNNYNAEINCLNNFNLTPGKEDDQNLMNYRMSNINYPCDINNYYINDSRKNMTHDKKEANNNVKNVDLSTESKVINHMKQKNEMIEENINNINHSYGLNFYNVPCLNNEYNNNGFTMINNNNCHTNGEVNYNGNMSNFHTNDMSSGNNYYYGGDEHNKNSNSKEKNNNRNHSNTNNSTNSGSMDNNETIDNEHSIHNNDTMDNNGSVYKNDINDDSSK